MSITLKGEPREIVGSRHSRKLRAAGSIPCNLQDASGVHVNFSIDEFTFLAARRHHEHLFDIEVGSEEFARVTAADDLGGVAHRA